MGDSERIGFPDGSAEPFPGGLGSKRILAYHLAQAERFDGVVLAQCQTSAAHCPGGLRGHGIVGLLVSSVVEASNWQGSLSGEDQQQLPVDECAARRRQPDRRLRRETAEVIECFALAGTTLSHERWP